MPNTNQELSKDNWVVVISGGIRLYVDEDGKSFFEKVIAEDIKFVKFGDEIYRGSSVLYITKPDKLETGDRLRRGMWQCEKGHWNDRGVKKCDKCYF